MNFLTAVRIALLSLIFVMVVPLMAQPPSSVTADDVNAIAKKLYCPVCENIPLDTCGTAACEDWRYEIRLQLEAGYTEQQIIDDFIARFGERVVGTPQDPFLRALSLVTPWIIVLLAGIGIFYSFFRIQRPEAKPQTSQDPQQDVYRQLLEQDL